MIRFVASAGKVTCRDIVRTVACRIADVVAVPDGSKCSRVMRSFPFIKSNNCFDQQVRHYYERHEDFFSGPLTDLSREPKKKKKKKKKKKPEKIIPPMDPIDVALQKMKMRFEEIEKEHLGGKRGVRTVKWLAGKKCEGLHKTVTTKMANTILNSWVYCRHALQHGHYQLNDMTKLELAESILGKGTKVKVPDREARIILKELFRFGKSSQLERYMELDRAKRKLMGRQEANTQRNLVGIPKIRNLATREEMLQHGYTQEEISDEMHKRARHEYNRLMKIKSREMPAYLRNEISGSRRRDAERVLRLQRRKEKRTLRKKLESEARRKALGLPISENDDGSGTDDGNISNDDKDSDYDDLSDSGDSDGEGQDSDDDSLSDSDDSDDDDSDDDALSDFGDSDDDDSDDDEEASDTDDDDAENYEGNDSSDKSVGIVDRAKVEQNGAIHGNGLLVDDSDGYNDDEVVGENVRFKTEKQNLDKVECDRSGDEINVDASIGLGDLEDDNVRRR
jgi:hypothetical protein